MRHIERFDDACNPIQEVSSFEANTGTEPALDDDTSSDEESVADDESVSSDSSVSSESSASSDSSVSSDSTGLTDFTEASNLSEFSMGDNKPAPPSCEICNTTTNITKTVRDKDGEIIHKTYCWKCLEDQDEP